MPCSFFVQREIEVPELLLEGTPGFGAYGKQSCSPPSDPAVAVVIIKISESEAKKNFHGTW